MKTTLITGASSGIGLEFAKLFAQNGYTLILVARNEDKLNQLASEIKKSSNVEVHIIPKDLSDRNAPQEIFDELTSKNISLDILVNNAGFGDYAEFSQAKPAALSGMIDVNVTALTMLTRLFLPDMIAKKSGKIMNVASTAAFEPGPYMAVYFASKAYVLSLTEALAEELADTGVSATALCPGPTQTGFEKQANDTGVPLFKGKVMNAHEVAKIGYSGMMKERRIVVPGLRNKVLVQLPRFFPRAWVVKIVKNLLK